MQSLHSLLSAIPDCSSCELMNENKLLDVQFISVVPKPFAKVVFIGRDPSPRTAKVVGLREGRSVFINEIFGLVDEARIADDLIYITDLCKCHWRTSVGTPLPKTEHRSKKLDAIIARTCMGQWLIPEICTLQPRFIVTFGEEVYRLLLQHITHPDLAPPMLSASADKSIPDAEFWFVENGPLSVWFDGVDFALAPMRHPGNSSRLPKSSTKTDRRYEYYQLARNQVKNLIEKACSLP